MNRSHLAKSNGFAQHRLEFWDDSLGFGDQGKETSLAAGPREQPSPNARVA